MLRRAIRRESSEQNGDSSYKQRTLTSWIMHVPRPKNQKRVCIASLNANFSTLGEKVPGFSKM